MSANVVDNKLENICHSNQTWHVKASILINLPSFIQQSIFNASSPGDPFNFDVANSDDRIFKILSKFTKDKNVKNWNYFYFIQLFLFLW